MSKPSLPQGTRDFGPDTVRKRNFIFNTIRTVFELYGFQPLETPAMENLETLMGKYGEEGDKLIFKILNNGLDHPAKHQQAVEDFAKVLEGKSSKSITERALRYDLTIPFARFVAANYGQITLPFKRYQIQPVWRADRPQKGRYREFFQCDADVVGTDSLVNEAEIVLMIKEVFGLLQIKDFTIKINHRGVLSGLAETAGAKGNEGSLFVAIDKLDKIGEDKVAEELRTKGFTDENINQVFETLKTTGTNAEKIQKLSARFTNSESGKKGLADLTEVFKLLQNFGSTEANVEFDISLARGLSYYTGPIFEVKVNNVSIGSVSGGGRYDNLTQAFGSKERLSGVGISF